MTTIDDIDEYTETAIWQAAITLQWQASDATGDGNAYPVSERGDEYTSRIVAEVPYLTEALTAFVAGNVANLAGIGAGQCGHDFILTANRHGAGFWDRGLGAIGGRLTEAAHGYGIDAEFALDADGDIDYLRVGDAVIVNAHEWTEGTE
jgi:hypothetical protein